jgi:phosphate transport system substrate-binding protein
MAGDNELRITRRLLAALLLAALAGGCGEGAAASALRVSGSTTVSPIASDAAEVLRSGGMRVTVDTHGGSAGGIAQLGEGQIDIAMSSKPLDGADRAAYPDVEFVATLIGQDALGVVVDQAVYDSGVTSLDSDALRRLFAGEVENWSELGGADLPVFVYQKEPGRGTFEVLVDYLYPGGDVPPPPDSSRYAVVGGNEEARTKLASTPGSVGPLSVAFAERGEGLAAVAVDGVAPTAEAVRDGRYPLARPLYLLTDGEPSGAAAEFIAFVLSEEGQALVTRNGYLALDELEVP